MFGWLKNIFQRKPRLPKKLETINSDEKPLGPAADLAADSADQATNQTINPIADPADTITDPAADCFTYLKFPGNGKIQRQKQIKKQVQRIKIVNDPNYQRPDDEMFAIIKDGVITYRKKPLGRKKKKEAS